MPCVSRARHEANTKDASKPLLAARNDGDFGNLGVRQQAATVRAQGYVLSIAASFICVGAILDVVLAHYGLGAAAWCVCTVGVFLLFTIGDLDIDAYLATGKCAPNCHGA